MLERVKQYAEENQLSKNASGYSRRNEDKFKRSYLYYYLRSKGISFKKIGECFGLDHATVINGIKRYHELKRYQDFQIIIEEVKFEFPLLDGMYADAKHIRVTDSLRMLQKEFNNRMFKTMVRKEVKKLVY